MPFDDRICMLGEGPLWHPEREAFFWFDILGRRLLTPGAEWQFDEYVSAAGWLDRSAMLIASQSQLFAFDLETATREHIAPLEADNPHTRSNDGRADPQGGFWIGTMSIDGGNDKAGAIYRYYRGEVRQLWDGISIPNSTCFAPDGKTAYFADTPTRQIMRVGLDPHGWPKGAPDLHVDLQGDALNPDGAVVDSDGVLWVALWGAGRVDGFAPDGTRIATHSVSAPHCTCPAFGGTGLREMLVTSATSGMDAAALAGAPQSGRSFLIETDRTGQPEHQVVL